MATHPRPTPSIPLGNSLPTPGPLNPLDHHLRRNSHSPNIVQVRIARLRDDRQEKPIHQPGPLISILTNRILVDAAVTRTHGEGVGDDDGRVEQTRFVQPVRAGHFTGAIEAEVPRVAGPVEPVAAGEDGCNACVYGVADAGACGGVELDGFRVYEHAGDVR
ncbi:S-adenosylmethionine-dependent methyltransferase [Histoplasma capsulatum G186AR]|uniref:S-adenosylmethionine-dependent methyltransferase n=1 Tax=Ajellomyces capsulatus TaxID=5037 RepID=A0A8H8CT03_AJECA|nr:S-adenosylmethionine-dependent methyltransferase [Histoplasma capsulatum]QSS70468.1 S-adenosylmethionine-dependent methyltransferase [Histoplasma capsulatum G186AR]